MRRSLRPWLVVVPLATFGVLAGHEIAYALSRTPHGDLHGYMSHLPQVALLLALLSLVGASFVERGHGLTLWPFPAVVLVAFVAQEHLERLAHGGSVPFLLGEPVFLVGLAVQAVIAIAAWLLARMLVQIVGTTKTGTSATYDSIEPPLPVIAPVGDMLSGPHGARAPPFDR